MIDALFATLPNLNQAKKLSLENRYAVVQHQRYLHQLQSLLYGGNLGRSISG
jgi:hypothetical protein